MAKNSDTAKPASDAYTGMLAIALLALIVGCVMLYLDYSQYPGNAPTPPKYPLPAATAPAPGGAAPAPAPDAEKK